MADCGLLQFPGEKDLRWDLSHLIRAGLTLFPDVGRQSVQGGCSAYRTIRYDTKDKIYDPVAGSL